VLGVGLVCLALYTARGRGLRPPTVDRRDRETWRMPPSVLLSPPPPSRARRIAFQALSSYLVVAVVMLLVKAVQLATGH
jgi:hypothetical protein